MKNEGVFRRSPGINDINDVLISKLEGKIVSRNWNVIGPLQLVLEENSIETQ